MIFKRNFQWLAAYSNLKLGRIFHATKQDRLSIQMLATCLAPAIAYSWGPARRGDHFSEQSWFCWSLNRRFSYFSDSFFLFTVLSSFFSLVWGRFWWWQNPPPHGMKNLRPEVTNPLKSVRVVLGPKLSLGDNEQTGSPQNKKCLVSLVEVLVNLGDVLLSRTSWFFGRGWQLLHCDPWEG